MQVTVPGPLPTTFHPLINSTWSSSYGKMSLPWLYNKVDLAPNREVLHLEFHSQYHNQETRISLSFFFFW